MARFIVQTRLEERLGMQNFNAGGYRYRPNRSDPTNLVFMPDATV